MRVLGFRTVAIIYPFLSLEMKIEMDNEQVVYANISVNDTQKEIEIEDNYIDGWVYDCQLDKIEDVDNHYAYITENDRGKILAMMVYFWNYYLTFDNDLEWKHAECPYGCSSCGYLCNGNPYETRCGQWEIEKGCEE